MPNNLDTFSLSVVVEDPDADLTVSPSSHTVGSGETVDYAFMFKPGEPSADRFSVAWYTNSSRVTLLSSSQAPHSPRFTPATPTVQEDGAAIENPNIFYPGTLRITAPVQAPLAEMPETPVFTNYFGRMTIHQV